MHLKFQRNHLQFFFVTLILEGRPKVLAELVEGEKRTKLTPLGEVVKEALLEISSRFPGVGTSEFAIMPDHLHFVLIFDYRRAAKSLDPLKVSYWLMEEVEEKARGLGRPRTLAQGTDSIVFDRSVYIELSFDSRQLAAVRRYIRMNPTRALWKLHNPDMFLTRRVRHPLLRADLPWKATGDLTILASPFLYPVRITRKKTLEELEPEIAEHVARAAKGGVPLCGFISPGEREFERRLKALPRSRWIKAVPYGLPPRFDPSVDDSEHLAAHRELILSAFDSADFAPFKITREGCLAMNERLVEIAAL